MTAKKSAAKKAAQDRANDNLDPNPGEPQKPLTAKAARKVPMYVDSVIHLPGKEKDGKQGPPVQIAGGVLLDELDEELDDDQIDELIKLKAIRPATQAEIAAADARAEAAAATDNEE